jgi:hypothetical protein
MDVADLLKKQDVLGLSLALRMGANGSMDPIELPLRLEARRFLEHRLSHWHRSRTMEEALFDNAVCQLITAALVYDERRLGDDGPR